MSKSAVVTARLDAETSERLDTLAAARERSRSWLITKAVQRYLDEELEFLAFVQVGIDDLAAGRVVPHAEVMAELDAMIAKHEARCRT